MKKPHDGVYTRIQASKIHGVGVFAIRNIKKGTYVFPGDDDELVWIKKNTLKNVPKGIKRLYEDFCLIKEKGKIKILGAGLLSSHGECLHAKEMIKKGKLVPFDLRKIIATPGRTFEYHKKYFVLNVCMKLVPMVVHMKV